ncbi:hypothetical protein OOJ91_13895 [Micromonospora lupini]|uniref:hypothetical protein n=1 Tax=Micromonospora lupini TaxID=285679 RepID=UPI0022570120|nr:hypothetical protein [Micromonospora lupini]MCX5066940.1 hypothetical protein [Micromonospora lupini]
MITLTRADRDDLALVAMGLDRASLSLRLGPRRAQRIWDRCGTQQRALELVDLFDGLADRPVLEHGPFGPLPGRVVAVADA